MKIILDGSDAVVGTRAIRRYTINLIAELPAIGAHDRFTVFMNYFRGDADIVDRKIAGAGNATAVRWACPRHFSLPLWDRLGVPSVDLFTEPADIFHALGDDCPPIKSAAYIITLHGIVYMKRADLIDPNYVQKKSAWLNKMTQRADYFVAVSETTRQEFLEFFPTIDSQRVRVIPLGIGSEFRVFEKEHVRKVLLQEFNISRPYILYVGGLQTHKNIEGTIRGFSLLARHYPDLDLVLVGRENGKACDVEQLIGSLKLEERITILDYISQEEDGLPILYNGAELFVFPSFVEGWTSPPLEAMACGTPVVTSNVSSLPETVGDAALMIDPNYPEYISAAMERLLCDSALRRALRHKGLQHAAQYSWKRCAENTYAFYRDVAAS